MFDSVIGLDGVYKTHRNQNNPLFPVHRLSMGDIGPRRPRGGERDPGGFLSSKIVMGHLPFFVVSLHCIQKRLWVTSGNLPSLRFYVEKHVKPSI